MTLSGGFDCSPEGYRYTLTRGPWLNGEGTVLFVMLRLRGLGS